MERLNPDPDFLITKFSDLLKLVTEGALKEEYFLPMTHVPNPYNIGRIISDGYLEPSIDENTYTNERLVFFYYGRSPYLSEIQRRNYFYIHPSTVFIFDCKKIHKPIKRILPFDSGYFKYYPIKPAEINHFEINSPALDDLKKLIVVLFKTFSDYLDYKYNFDEIESYSFTLPQLERLKTLYSQSNGTNNSEIDYPSITIEIQYDQNIPLSIDNVLIANRYYTVPNTKKQIDMAFRPENIIIYIDDPNPIVNRRIIDSAFSTYLNNKINKQ